MSLREWAQDYLRGVAEQQISDDRNLLIEELPAADQATVEAWIGAEAERMAKGLARYVEGYMSHEADPLWLDDEDDD